LSDDRWRVRSRCLQRDRAEGVKGTRARQLTSGCDVAVVPSEGREGSQYLELPGRGGRPYRRTTRALRQEKKAKELEELNATLAELGIEAAAAPSADAEAEQERKRKKKKDKCAPAPRRAARPPLPRAAASAAACTQVTRPCICSLAQSPQGM